VAELGRLAVLRIGQHAAEAAGLYLSNGRNGVPLPWLSAASNWPHRAGGPATLTF
jgi:hypothetical protein